MSTRNRISPPAMAADERVRFLDCLDQPRLFNANGLDERGVR